MKTFILLIPVKIYHYRYEAFVYDDRLEHVYVRNRFLAWNIGRYKQKSDIVERENISIAQFLLKGNLQIDGY